MNYMICLQITRRVHGTRNQLKAIPITTESVSSEWENAKPFAEMPGPKGLPLLGNTWRILPGVGEFSGTDFYTLQKRLQLKYGNLVRFDKVFGREPFVFVMNPSMVEQIYRKEGPWPERHTFPSFDYYKEVTRREEWRGMGTAAVSQGEEWKMYRSKFNPYLMRPREFVKYLPSIDEVTIDFLQRILHLRDENNNLPDNFLAELYKWCLELIGAVAMDKRFGCVDIEIGKGSTAQKLIPLAYTLFDCFEILDTKFPLWKFVSTPTWRLFVKTVDDLRQLVINLIDETVAKVDSMSEDRRTGNSMVYDLVSTYDKKTATSFFFDMIIGGIVAPSYSISTLMYFLSKNPDKQERLFLEVKSHFPDLKAINITSEMLQEMKYLKACMKESARLRPLKTVNVRSAHTDDYVLGGYRIPKGAFLVLCNMLLSNSEEIFPKADKFIPERWLSESNREVNPAKDAHSFAYKPFGFGPRACIGKRFADLGMELLISRVIRNFRLEFDGELRYRSEVFQLLDSDLKFKLIDRES